MTFLNSSVNEFLGMIFLFPFAPYIFLTILEGIEDSIIYWFRIPFFWYNKEDYK